MKKAFLLIAFCFLDEQKPGLYLWWAPLYLVQSLPSLVTFPWFCASSLLRAFCKYCGWSSTGVLLGLVKVKVAQSCWTLCEPVDCTVLGILQARILEWVAIAFSRGSSWPRNRTGVSCIAGRFFTIWAIRVVPNTRMKAKKSTSSLLRFLRRPRNSIALPHVGHEQLRHRILEDAGLSSRLWKARTEDVGFEDCTAKHRCDRGLLWDPLFPAEPSPELCTSHCNISQSDLTPFLSSFSTLVCL